MANKAYYTMFPGGRQKVFTLSYDDGNDCDIPVIDLMRRLGIKGTFNLNSGRMPDEPITDSPKRWHVLSKSEIRTVYGDDMEVAVHGKIHPWWDRMPSEAVLNDILEDKKELERITGHPILGCASPEGRVTPASQEALRLAGIRYCRIDGVGTYQLSIDKLDPDFLFLRPTCKYSDARLPELTNRFLSGEGIRNHLWMLYVWGHSFEHVRENDFGIVEKLLTKVAGRSDIWYATNIELVNYLLTAKRLRFNMDQTIVENPTSSDIWISKTDAAGTIVIPAGQTVRL